MQRRNFFNLLTIPFLQRFLPKPKLIMGVDLAVPGVEKTVASLVQPIAASGGIVMFKKFDYYTFELECNDPTNLAFAYAMDRNIARVNEQCARMLWQGSHKLAPLTAKARIGFAEYVRRERELLGA